MNVVHINHIGTHTHTHILKNLQTKVFLKCVQMRVTFLEGNL